MDRAAYELANRIKTEPEADWNTLAAGPGEIEMKKYKKYIVDEISRERKEKRKNSSGMYVAACAALILIIGTVSFGDEVHAMIRQVSWSIGNALGIASDLADYREVVNTSVADSGYVITLQDAVAFEEKLVINYTLQREDGGVMDGMPTADGSLYINGKNVTDGASGSAEFLDDEQKIVGVVLSYYVSDVDFSQENNFRITYDRVGTTDSVKGKWEFEFTADGTDLIADTKRIGIEKTFELPDGVKVTLNELIINDLEQGIYYSLSDATDHILKVEAVDSTGKQVEFGVRTQDKESGYMQNEEIIDDGRIDENAKSVTMTLYAVELPKESGQMSNDYVQLGEPFILEF